MMFPWLYSNVYRELSMFDEPNTLYAFMQSIVNFGKDEQVKIKDLPKYAKSTIFNFDYPISPLFGKEQFEELFLTHYMFRRINYDTLLAFQLHLQVKLNEIMPKYNKMIEGFNKLEFDGTVETHTRTQSDSNESASNVNSTSSDSSVSDTKYSDTPQGMLEEVQSGEYMSEYTYNTGNTSGSTESNTSSNSSGSLEENITIKRADSIEEYTKFMEIANNIYSSIFKECDDLFYGII